MADDRYSDPLALDREAMRLLGYRTVDRLVELLGTPPAAAIRRASPGQMRERLFERPPEQPTPYDDLLDVLVSDVLPYRAFCDHPAYLAYVPGSGTWPGALGDFIASALNVDASWWLGAAGPSAIELVVLDWFREWIGYPPQATGVLVSGGSAANMTALACARETLVGAMHDDLVGYVSDQTHSSVARGARVLGFRPDQIRVLPVDETMRLRPDALAGALDADRRAGRRPLFVVANAGTTNSGAVDPLREIAATCHAHGVWLHVDGAYGGFAALTTRGRHELDGIDLADSVTVDPHKWLYQPFECGALLVRRAGRLRSAFEITPDYLKDVVAVADEVNFSDLGVQLTRSFRALKVWLSIKTFGTAAFRAVIDHNLDLVCQAQARINASQALELMTPASLGIVTFRRHPPGVDDEDALERVNADLVSRLEESGLGFVSSTRLTGRYAIRLCVLNHTTTAEHVTRVLDFLETAVVDTAAHAPRYVEHDRNPGLRDGWLGRAQLDSGALRALPLFASLNDDAARDVLVAVRERHTAPGEMIIEQWQAGRDLYLVLEGSVDIRVDHETLWSVGAGDFFGEFAALDWGAQFGYVRLASVVSTAPTRLLVLPTEALNALMQRWPDVAERIRRRVQERFAEPATGRAATGPRVVESTPPIP
jgi:aromatic-L-amino-acid/L-tryptophan decarboxylase